MKWHCIEPGHHASECGWHIDRFEERYGRKRIEQWWNPYAPDEKRGGPVWKSFGTLKEAKEYAEEQAAESGVSQRELDDKTHDDHPM